MVWTFIKWVITESVVMSFNLSQWNQYSYAEDADTMDEIVADYPEIDLEDMDDSSTTTSPPIDDSNNTIDQEKETLFSCDHRITLYILNQSYFLNSMGVSPVVSEEKAGQCHSPYWATLVTKTNLLLVVVDKNYRPDESCELPPDTKPRPTRDSTTSREPCHKLDLGRLTRRRLEGCFTYHDKENNITACGLASLTRSNALTFVAAAVLASLFTSFIS